MTKIKVVKRKIKQSYDKNQVYQEKLNPDIKKKSRSPRKIEDSYKKIKVFKKKFKKNVMTEIEVVKKNWR